MSETPPQDGEARAELIARTDRMIQAMPEHADRNWASDPIQDSEREWMRPIALAAAPVHPNAQTDGEDWTGGRAWPDQLEAIAEYWAEWEENRAGPSTFSAEELAENAGQFATGLADYLATLPPQGQPKPVEAGNVPAVCGYCRAERRNFNEMQEHVHFAHNRPSSPTPTTTEAGGLREALEEADFRLVEAFQRIHALPRSTDSAMSTRIARTRVKIAAALASSPL